MRGPAYDDGIARCYQGDAGEVLSEMAPGSVQCVVTSPPYWRLRDYGVEGQLGLELSPQEYIARMVAVFREVWRVLRSDGTLWLNMGDCYGSSVNGTSHARDGLATLGEKYRGGGHRGSEVRPDVRTFRDEPFATVGHDIKPKDKVLMPHRLAIALCDDGWHVRQDIVWSKPNPMPESVTDRPTAAHEYLFFLTKSERYWYDAEAIREASVGTEPGTVDGGPQRLPDGSNANGGRNYRQPNGLVHSPHGQGFTRRSVGDRLAGAPANVKAGP